MSIAFSDSGFCDSSAFGLGKKKENKKAMLVAEGRDQYVMKTIIAEIVIKEGDGVYEDVKYSSKELGHDSIPDRRYLCDQVIVTSKEIMTVTRGSQN